MLLFFIIHQQPFFRPTATTTIQHHPNTYYQRYQNESASQFTSVMLNIDMVALQVNNTNLVDEELGSELVFQ